MQRRSFTAEFEQASVSAVLCFAKCALDTLIYTPYNSNGKYYDVFTRSVTVVRQAERIG